MFSAFCYYDALDLVVSSKFGCRREEEAKHKSLSTFAQQARLASGGGGGATLWQAVAG
jgi:hypothetical protein